MSDLLIRSFIISDLSESLTVALLSWVTWAIRSQSLFCHEQPERFAHSRSFILSDLSKSLKVTHLIWVIWANEGLGNEQMSKFPTLFSLVTYKTNSIFTNRAVSPLCCIQMGWLGDENCCFCGRILTRLCLEMQEAKFSGLNVARVQVDTS